MAKFQVVRNSYDASRPFAVVGVPGQGYDYRVWNRYATEAQAKRRARTLNGRN
jgi:hypothetical protein